MLNISGLSSLTLVDHGCWFSFRVQEESGTGSYVPLWSICTYTRALETWSYLIIHDNSETPSPPSISADKTSGLTLLCNILRTSERVSVLPPLTPAAAPSQPPISTGGHLNVLLIYYDDSSLYTLVSNRSSYRRRQCGRAALCLHFLN